MFFFYPIRHSMGIQDMDFVRTFQVLFLKFLHHAVCSWLRNDKFAEGFFFLAFFQSYIFVSYVKNSSIIQYLVDWPISCISWLIPVFFGQKLPPPNYWRYWRFSRYWRYWRFWRYWRYWRYWWKFFNHSIQYLVDWPISCISWLILVFFGQKLPPPNVGQGLYFVRGAGIFHPWGNEHCPRVICK